MYNNKQKWQEMHNTKKEVIEAFRDRRFGMLIHFGLYALLAGESKGKRMEEGRSPTISERIMHSFSINRAEYA